MKLTPNQVETLSRFRLGLPKSMGGWPGVPYNMVDQRSIGALEKRGLVEGCMHERFSQSAGGIHRTPCYRLTDAGRELLSEMEFTQ